MISLAPELRIVEYQNEWIVRSPYRPAELASESPQLRELRERYHLDEVIAGRATEWEQLLRLREWVHQRWSHGWSSAPLHDAREILARAARGEDFHCEYYAATLTQCALALGFTARRLDISKSESAWIASDEENIGHSVVEVWSQVGDDPLTPVVNVRIEHSAPSLEHLLVKIGEAGVWAIYREPFLWTIQPGKNVIEAKPINRFGREGYTSRIALRYFRPAT